jgi:hypothetical protein
LVTVPGWDVYIDKRAEEQLELGSPVGRRALSGVLDDLCEHGPQIYGARPYPPPHPSNLWRAPITVGGTEVYGAVEYVEEFHQRIRVTWAVWLPGR